MCANFGQVSLEGPRIAINPHRLYPIEPAIRRERRFALGLLSQKQRNLALRLRRLRRRAPNKAALIGLDLDRHPAYDIPYAPSCFHTLFCEAEEILDAGDHTLIIANVIDTFRHPGANQEKPLLYPAIAGEPTRYPRLRRALVWALSATGVKDRLQEYLQRRRNTQAVDLSANTYEDEGRTHAEVQLIASYGLRDTSRQITPPLQAPAALRRRFPLCVVGAGQWGAFHCRVFSAADPHVDLYVCGRDPQKVGRLARTYDAKDVIIGLDRALEDHRLEALTLALPHHMHALAAVQAAAAGKHVLVEKPIARTLAEADAMIDAAGCAGTTLMVAEDMHYRPAIRKASELIDAGEIGEPLYLLAHGGGVLRPRGWRADPEQMGGGIFMDAGVHYVRALRLLMGEPDEILAAHAMQIDTKLRGEDSVQVWFRSRFGWQANLLLAWSTPHGHSPDLIVCGDRGTLHLWPGRNFVDLYPAVQRSLPWMLSMVRPAWLAAKLIRPEMQRVRYRFSAQDRQGYLTEAREFLAAVAEHRRPASPAGDGRRDLEIVLRGYASLHAEPNQWVNCETPASPVLLREQALAQF
jgi:predicted dehydrogenase/flavin reductase (DIM6/NTAB) family NADH-FMN oxidoreductase RutF